MVDGYAISTNRGVDVLKYIAIPKYDSDNEVHAKIANISREIHYKFRERGSGDGNIELESSLDKLIHILFS